jgi:hypothetical protein
MSIFVDKSPNAWCIETGAQNWSICYFFRNFYHCDNVLEQQRQRMNLENTQLALTSLARALSAGHGHTLFVEWDDRREIDDLLSV